MPATTKRTIQLDERDQDIAPQPRLNELALEQVPLRIEHLKIAVETALIPRSGKTIRFAERAHKELLLLSQNVSPTAHEITS